MYKKKFESAAELEREVDRYFAHCAEEDIFPDRADLIIFLGLSTDTYLKYEKK